LKKIIHITIEERKPYCRKKTESEAEILTKKINKYATRTAWGDGSRGPRRDTVKHFNEDFQKVTRPPIRGSGTSVDRFNRKLKDLI
jgi:hypothetical protein